MTMSEPKAAEALEKNAREIAERAAANLLSADPELRDRFGADAPAIWRDHLHQRLLELSAAVAVGNPNLFSTRIIWSQQAMNVRDLGFVELDKSLKALRDGIADALDEAVRSVCLGCFDAALAEAQARNAVVEETALDPGQPFDRLASLYIQAVLAGNAPMAMQLVLDSIEEGMAPVDLIMRTLLPAQREVGRLWHANQISIADEHLVTNTTQRLMAVLASRVRCQPDRGKTAIAASVPGNVHDIGIRSIAYLLEFDGWRTIYLGSDTPRGEIVAAVDSFEADLVLLSVALSSQFTALKRMIDEIRAGKSGNSVKILVGGNGFAGEPELWRSFGADGYAPTADEALALAAELVD